MAGNLTLAYAELLAGGVLAAAALTGSSIGQIIGGQAQNGSGGLAAMFNASSAGTSGSSSTTAAVTGTGGPAVSGITPATGNEAGAFASPTAFATALLQGLGAPTTPGNVAAVTAWVNAEGGYWHNQAAFNPLNTTEYAPGSSYFQSTGPGSAQIRIYTSAQQGYNATLATLSNYPSIVNALRAGVSGPAQLSGIVAASPWGTGPFA